MKTLNRTLSLALVFALVFSLMSFAFAADTTTTTTTTTTPTTTTTTTPAATTTNTAAAFTDASSISHNNAVSTMTSLAVIKGYPDGSYKPATNVTRAEMAKMICLILNGGKEPVLSTSSTPKYTDIKGHWAQAYIEYCASANIVAGMGDGTFHPDDTVTASQAAKMLLVAMGYKSDVFNFTGSDWEVNVNVAANKANLYKEITDINASANLNRDNAAQMIYNAIFANTMAISYTQDQTTGKITQNYNPNGDPLSVTKFSLNVSTATLGTVTYNSTKKEYSYALTEEKYVSGYTVAGATDPAIGAKNMKSTTDYSAYVGMKVKILWNHVNGVYNIYGVYPYDSSVILSGVVGVVAKAATFEKNASGKILAMTYNGTTYKFNTAEDTTVVYSNSNSVTAPIAIDTLEEYISVAGSNPYLATFSFQMLDTNSDTIIDKVVVFPYTVEKVTFTSATNTTFQNVALGGASTSQLNANIKTYDGIKVGDYVKHTAAAYTSASIDTYEKISPIASGTVKAKGTLTATLDTVPTALGDVTNLMGSPRGLTLGATYENLIQVNGFIYWADLKVDAASAEKFAVVTKVATAPDAYGNINAKLLFSNGDVKEVPIVSYEGTPITYSGSAVVGAPAKGAFVYFKATDGKYTLNDISNDPGDHGNYDSYSNPLASTFSYTKGTINSYAIDDGAVVFANTDDGYKIITGAALKSASGLSAAPEILIKKGSNGFSTILCAYVDLSSQSIGTTKYGYVTDTPGTTTDKDKNTVSSITFWDGDKEVTKAASANYIDTDKVTVALKKGMFFRYTEDKDGIITITDEVPGGKVDFFAPTVAQVTGLTSDNKSISFSGSAYATEVVNDETVIFNIDSANCKGVVGKGLSQSNGTDANAAYHDTRDGSTTYVNFVAIDTKGKLQNYTAPTTVSYGASSTAAVVKEALTNRTNITIDGDWAPTDAIEIPANTTLTVNGKLDATGTLTVGTGATLNTTGNLTTKGDIDNSGTIKVDAAFAPQADVTTKLGKLSAGTYAGANTIVLKDGTLELTAPLTLTANMTIGATTSTAAVITDEAVSGAFALTITGDYTAKKAVSGVTTLTVGGNFVADDTVNVASTATLAVTGTTKFATAGKAITLAGIFTNTGAVTNAADITISKASTTIADLTNSGTVAVNANTTITKLTANTGSITVADAKVLTITDSAANAALEKIFGATNTSKLFLTADSAANYTTVATPSATQATYKSTSGASFNGTAAITANTTSTNHYVYSTTAYTWTLTAD